MPFQGRPTQPCEARRPRPEGRGWPGAWLCHLAHPMAPHRPSLASSPEALATGRLSARCSLGRSRFEKARGRRAGGHVAEGRQQRCPAQGQPGGTPRPGRTAASRLVADAPRIVLLTAPCPASQGAGVAPEIFPRSEPFIPAGLRRGHTLFRDRL